MQKSIASIKIDDMSAHTEAWTYLKEFSWYVGNPEMTTEEAQLRDLAALRSELEDLITMRVQDVHESGQLSWSQIGNIFGVTKQGAAQRWGRKH